MTPQKAQEIFKLLKKHYPNAKMILQWRNNFELLVSIILSAQCTDKKVNEVTAVVFPKYKNERPEFSLQYSKYTRMLKGSKTGPEDRKDPSTSLRSAQARKDDNLGHEVFTELVNFSFVPLYELEQDFKSTGFYHNKAKNVQEAAKTILEKFKGILPNTIAELVTIPGVGRKTANVFLGNAYGIYEGIAVDTHVTKQSQLLGLTKNTTPEKIEQDLMQLFPKDQWFSLTYLLIELGRNRRRKKSDRIVCNNSNCLLCFHS